MKGEEVERQEAGPSTICTVTCRCDLLRPLVSYARSQDKQGLNVSPGELMTLSFSSINAQKEGIGVVRSDGWEVEKPRKVKMCLNFMQTLYVDFHFSSSHIVSRHFIPSVHLGFSFLEEIVSQESLVICCGYFLQTCHVYVKG